MTTMKENKMMLNKDQLKKLLEQKSEDIIGFQSNAQKIVSQVAGLTNIKYKLVRKDDNWIVYEFDSDDRNEQLNLKRKTASAIKKLGFSVSGTYGGAGGSSNTFKSPEYSDVELEISIDWITFKKETKENIGERTRELSNALYVFKNRVGKYSLYLGADKTDKINQYINKIDEILKG